MEGWEDLRRPGVETRPAELDESDPEPEDAVMGFDSSATAFLAQAMAHFTVQELLRRDEDTP